MDDLKKYIAAISLAAVCLGSVYAGHWMTMRGVKAVQPATCLQATAGMQQLPTSAME